MAKLEILIDMDGILVDICHDWLRLYNIDYDDNISVADLKSYDTHESVKAECGLKIYDYIDQPNFFRNLRPIKGALESVRRLHEAGHGITILTAPSKSPTCAWDKVEWIKDHLPFLSRKDVITAHKKHLVKGDVFIDDKPANIRDYRVSWPLAKTMTIAYPYNKMLDGLADVYAEGYHDSEAAWQKIEAEVYRLAAKDL